MNRKRHHMITEQEKDRIMDLIERGEKVKNIAVNFDVTPSTIYILYKKRRAQ